MIEVKVNMNLLMDWLNEGEGGELYPKLKEDSEITGVEVGYGEITFVFDNEEE